MIIRYLDPWGKSSRANARVCDFGSAAMDASEFIRPGSLGFLVSNRGCTCDPLTRQTQLGLC